MTEQKRREILVETVKTFGRQEWFRDATIYDSHPNTGQATLEFKVNYVPVLQTKDIKEFVMRFNLTDKMLVVDKQGNPAE
jgi:hypothetical protein